MGDNLFIYDKVVREGTVTVSPGGNFQVGFEPSKIKNMWVDYVYRSSAGTKNANIDMESKGSVNVLTRACALYGLNLTSSYTTLKLQKYVSGWVDIGNFEYDADNGRAIITYSQVSVSKYRVVMNDPNVPSYVQLGVALLGDYECISRGYEYGATHDLDDSSGHLYSKDGHLSVREGREIEAQAVTYEVLSDDEERLETVYRAVRKKNPLVFVGDSTQKKQTMKYIIFEGRFGHGIPGHLFKRITLTWLRLD